MNLDNIVFIMCECLLYIGGFYTCRQCSMFFDGAVCEKNIKIRSTLWSELLISPTRKSFRTGHLVQPQRNNRSRMSLVGCLAYLIINCLSIFLFIITVQQKFLHSEIVIPIKVVASLLIVSIVLFQIVDTFNNKAI